jgi:hypothetical protein
MDIVREPYWIIAVSAGLRSFRPEYRRGLILRRFGLLKIAAQLNRPMRRFFFRRVVYLLIRDSEAQKRA